MQLRSTSTVTLLSTITDGETYADVRFGEAFIVSVDRTARHDAITVRVFHPDAPENVIGEHRLDLELNEDTETTYADLDPTMTDREKALG